MTDSIRGMSRKERQKILVEWNQTDSPFHHEKTLPTLFEEQAFKNENQIALRFGSQTLTYAELNKKANQLAHYLRQLNQGKKSFIAICMKPSLDLLIGIIAILKSGSAYVPLDFQDPVKRQQYILSDTKTKFLLTHTIEAKRFNQQKEIETLCLDVLETQLSRFPVTNPPVINQASDMAYLIYTSGSTGMPKGVMITHQNVHHYIHWFSQALAVVPDDVFDFSTPISFDFAVANTLFPLTQGATVAICDKMTKRDPYTYLNYLVDNKVTILKITPSHFRQFKEVVLQNGTSLTLRYIVFGGENLYAKDIEEWVKHFPKQTMFCEYGPTEATVATSWIKINKNNIQQYKNIIPIGKPVLNAKLYILDHDMEPVPIGEIGELYIAGTGVTDGYYLRKEMTDKKFIPDPFQDDKNKLLYKTGDLCRFLNDGNIEFVNREDNQVKVRGYRIELEEIEKNLIEFPAIKDAAVIIRIVDEETHEKQLIAYLVPHQPQTFDLAAFRDELTLHLPQYMIPSHFEIREELPIATSGKLDRKKLEATLLLANKEETIPNTELEKNLKTIWEKELGVKYIRVTDNFFYLGGHSLSAARITTKIRQEMKKQIQLNDLYEAPTIVGLARKIQQATTINIEPTTVQQQPVNNSTSPLGELQFFFWLMNLFFPNARIPNVIRQKRFSGTLEITKLNNALASTCKKHLILRAYIHHWIPVQSQQSLAQPKVEMISLETMSTEQQETFLRNSFIELQYRRWSNYQYPFAVRYFLLPNNICELQLALSHSISDEVSMKLILQDLSHFYLAETARVEQERHTYREYVLQMIEQSEREFDKSVAFWKNYFNGVEPLHFPDHHVLQKKNASNSITTEIDSPIIDRLLQYSTQNKISFSGVVMAAICLSLTSYATSAKKSMVLSVVKSARDNENYDKSVGLFLRTDMVRVDLDDNHDFRELCHHVQQAVALAFPFQASPVIMKLAYLFYPLWKNKTIYAFFATGFARLYAGLFPQCRLNSRVLKLFLFIARVKKKTGFLVNINIKNNVIEPINSLDLFHLSSLPIPDYPLENYVDQNVVNIVFERQGDAVQLIISSNLTVELLESLSKKIIDILASIEA